MDKPIIELNHVSRAFQVKRNTYIKAVDNVSMRLKEGEIVCLVGESGCGKTTTGKMIVGLTRPTSGEVLYMGKDISQLNKEEWKRFRLGVQMVHQDPYASLNPSFTIYDTLAAPLRHHGFTSGDENTKKRVIELLEMVDLTPASEILDKYPHQLSGGQRQRVSVARALTVSPSVLVADEAVSMVDVSIRISLLNTLLKLKERMGLAVLFITHDLALAKYFAWEGRIGVMYLGRMVEINGARELVDNPQHPYTQALLSAIPEADPDITRQKRHVNLRSMDVPSLLHLPTGCTFHPRCPLWDADICEKVVPDLVNYRDGSQVACHIVARKREMDAR
ncbi:oligopeptide/dipeptide ABC transporter, ATP-binding protein, C-terminal domain [Longilinea arvoryzae]|uniref:Oligopeptide/dipeptide ABC transporter, ATP-binding protein, C-terminal domain n=1 Tax=Longilinea arvoryzae TaxID=360412 RepID=A0A0S7BIL4_9CHLR|nr:ABC transporter ATP-binding protein [Longilinea arvoryzae]GAP13739.1 oligopeptide/dipeptide ABC transporter, ATP-binding protein, C-terminal domain [Longilinea arvoryzae]